MEDIGPHVLPREMPQLIGRLEIDRQIDADSKTDDDEEEEAGGGGEG